MVEKLIETWFVDDWVRTKIPVLQDPEVVVVVQAENPTGVMMLSRSQCATPPSYEVGSLEID